MQHSAISGVNNLMAMSLTMIKDEDLFSLLKVQGKLVIGTKF